jgi:hypothetical protein
LPGTVEAPGVTVLGVTGVPGLTPGLAGMVDGCPLWTTSAEAVVIRDIRITASK